MSDIPTARGGTGGSDNPLMGSRFPGRPRGQSIQSPGSEGDRREDREEQASGSGDGGVEDTDGVGSPGGSRHQSTTNTPSQRPFWLTSLPSGFGRLVRSGQQDGHSPTTDGSDDADGEDSGGDNRNSTIPPKRRRRRKAMNVLTSFTAPPSPTSFQGESSQATERRVPRYRQRTKSYGAAVMSAALSDRNWMGNFRNKVNFRSKKARPSWPADRVLPEAKLAQQNSHLLVTRLMFGSLVGDMLVGAMTLDEKGRRRNPVLYELLRVRVDKMVPIDQGSGRGRQALKIDLQYGHGPTRIKWTIIRSGYDFALLHYKLWLRFGTGRLNSSHLWSASRVMMPWRSKASRSAPKSLLEAAVAAAAASSANAANSNADTPAAGAGGKKSGADGTDKSGRTLPRFPLRAFPRFRSIILEATTGQPPPAAAEETGAVDENAASALDNEGTDAVGAGVTDVDFTDVEMMTPAHGGIESSTAAVAQTPTTAPPAPTASRSWTHRHRLTSMSGAAGRKEKGNKFGQHERLAVQSYLIKLIEYARMGPASNRLARFFELSALGIRLSSEGGFHGKEGSMVIWSCQARDFRNAWTPQAMNERRQPKWFMVRDSYIVVVESPEEMNIYDVILVDSSFSIRIGRHDSQDATGRLAAGEAASKKTPPIARAGTMAEMSEKAHGGEPTASGHAAADQNEEVSDFKAFKALVEAPAYTATHQLKLVNAENRIRLRAQTTAQQLQFEQSIREMLSKTIWSERHRFRSFAPVRMKVHAQWLVDGRDYMWNASRAISMAREVIYIHDWWLSPELFMRRPGEISLNWRIDRLLKEKADQGVKVYVIVYDNIDASMPIESSYTRSTLEALHPTNICVVESPNKLRQKTLYYAHHEKTVVVDHMVAFCGGIDLCFGRWDTPDHVLVDDGTAEAGQVGGHQVWLGKDYSNPRERDFIKLDKPFADLHNRQVVPRMPWHDVGMQVVGQPARDLSRHFVQRWNYLVRQRIRREPTPMLLPPPDFQPNELERLGLSGTCEVQVLRSAGAWSLGLRRTESSIEEAYVRLIETSNHFVYVENQFFITSTVVDGVTIKNRIGCALVERIKRAHQERQANPNKKWRAVIIIPLMPGFAGDVDEGSTSQSSLRRIVYCQYLSICRGPYRGTADADNSIFSQLKKADIEPDEYISFYGLRQWGEIGLMKTLVTEQLYIHAKLMIVDDMSAIIGSANINERSMRGNRDSEVAMLVIDHDQIDSTMGDEPVKVGRFPHTLRMRLMREHLGLDVDRIAEEEIERAAAAKQAATSTSTSSSESEAVSPTSPVTANTKFRAKVESPGVNTKAIDKILQSPASDLTSGNHADRLSPRRTGFWSKPVVFSSFNHEAADAQRHSRLLRPNPGSRLPWRRGGSSTNEADHGREGGSPGDGHHLNQPSDRDTAIGGDGRETLVQSNDVSESAPATSLGRQGSRLSVVPEIDRARSAPHTAVPAQTERGSSKGRSRSNVGADAASTAPSDQAGRTGTRSGRSEHSNFNDRSNLTVDQQRVVDDYLSSLPVNKPVTDDCMKDPLTESFYLDVWDCVATRNTALYRKVFRCIPDNEVRTLSEYQEYAKFRARMAEVQGVASIPRVPPEELKMGTDQSSRVVAPPPAPVASVAKMPDLPRRSMVDKLLWNRSRSQSRDGKSGPTAEDRQAGDLDPDRPDGLGEDEGGGPAGPRYHDESGQSNPDSDSNTTDTRQQTKPAEVHFRRSRQPRPFQAHREPIDLAVSAELMSHATGPLVDWPYDFLAHDPEMANWMFDKVVPLKIFT